LAGLLSEEAFACRLICQACDVRKSYDLRNPRILRFWLEICEGSTELKSNYSEIVCDTSVFWIPQVSPLIGEVQGFLVVFDGIACYLAVAKFLQLIQVQYVRSSER
jgi:hypothetical protein